MVSAKQKSNQVMGGSLQDLSAERAAKRNDSDKSKASAPPSGADELILDLHAEQSALGSILQRNDYLDSVALPLAVDDFGDSRHQKLFRAMLEEHENGQEFNGSNMEATLRRKGLLKDVGGVAYLGELIDIADMPESESILRQHVKTIKDYAARRIAQHAAEELDSHAQLASTTQEFLLAKARSIVEELEARQSSDGAIRSFAEIPDILTLNIPEPEYFVDGLIARGTITEWTGLGGAMKSFMIQKMAVAVAQGTSFLGMKCRRGNVLYLDYENPGFVVKKRLCLMTNEPLSGLKVWGKWLPQTAPPIGDATLLRLLKEMQPLLLIIDPLRDAHSADENSSSEMKQVMDHLRSYSSLEAAVLTVHHVARYDGSMSRGSTAIFDAMDVALLQQKDEKTGIVSLQICKHRWAEIHTFSLKVDFRNGDVEVVENPKAAQEAEELKVIYRIIQMTPGIYQNQIVEASGIRKSRVGELLGQNLGVLWTMQPDGQKRRYYPHSRGSQ